MDDKFLHDLRREPAPEFSRRLRTSLREQDLQAQGNTLGLRSTRWVGLAASIAVLSIAFTFPAVRAGAQAFLDLFRVVNVAGISFDAERLSEIDFGGLDLRQMLGEQIEVLSEPNTPTTFETLADAGTAAGSRVLVPAWMPVGWELTGIMVGGEESARITASTNKLQLLLDLLAIDDLSIPVGLDGQTATLHVPPIVHLTYSNADKDLRLIQARTPEVSFPAGLDLPVLAEIGLRIMGLERDEAYRLAWGIDWRSTLILPVPTAEASFRKVNVAGRDGLLVDPIRGSRSEDSVLLWATDDQVFAISARLASVDLLEMAQTLQ